MAGDIEACLCVSMLVVLFFFFLLRLVCRKPLRSGSLTYTETSTFQKASLKTLKRLLENQSHLFKNPVLKKLNI